MFFIQCLMTVRMLYALYFVPHKQEREKLALMRRQLCKRFENRKAIMYPVHLTLVRCFTLDDYKRFMKELEAYCLQQKPIRLRASDNLATRNGWGGVEIEQTGPLARLQQELVELAGRHGEVEENGFDPHISLVYSKRLPQLGTKSSPVKKLLLDRVTLVLQTTPGTPYRIVKHVALGGVADADD